MANVLSSEKQAAIISLLAEGSSIRSIERVKGVHRDTIMRLGVRVGKGRQMLLDVKCAICHANSYSSMNSGDSLARRNGIARHDHEAPKAYALAHCTDDNKRKVITVLHTDLVSSRALAVRGYIVQEFRNRGLEN